MTLPETLKAARIEAITQKAWAMRQKERSWEELETDHPAIADIWREEMRKLLSSDPLEPIVEALVEALGAMV